MLEITPHTWLYLSAALLCLGIFLVLTRRNGIGVLMGLELILNASNINLVAFGNLHRQTDGIVFALFVIVVAAAEAAVALAIVLNLYDKLQTIDVEDASELRH